MDEKKAFEIRRKVLESGIDFEEYISKQHAEIDELKGKAIQAIGWAYADCCAELDSGGDPRTMEMTDVLARAMADLELKHTGE